MGDSSITAPTPYRRGWRAPWRHQWGGFSDGHSRLSKLAKRIAVELSEVYAIETAHDRRRLVLAARYLALSEKTLATMDLDPKSTRRAATALQKTAEMQLATLARRASPAEATFADLVRGNGAKPKGDRP
jgi:hypothetical protein